MEPTLNQYLDNLLQVTSELRRVLKPTGVMFWNHGDCYGGSGCGKGDYRNNNKRSISNPNLYCEKPNPHKNIPAKCLAMQNYRLIIRMLDEQGWLLRNTIIWHKPNHMPSSVKDRFTGAYEPIFMLVKNKKYWFDLDAVRVPHKSYEQEMRRKILDNKGKEHLRRDLSNRPRNAYYYTLGKNPGDVWTIPTQPMPMAHFATFPVRLIEPMVKAGCPQYICKKCGTIRKRIIETRYKVHKEEPDPKKTTEEGRKANNFGTMRFAKATAEHYTVGWTDCGCNAGWSAGIVLDPFMGSGTTAVVSIELGRKWIGIELNPKYCEIAKKRIQKVSSRRPLITE